jgi:hypothetical protein
MFSKHKHTNKNSTLKFLQDLFNVLQMLHTKLDKFILRFTPEVAGLTLWTPN